MNIGSDMRSNKVFCIQFHYLSLPLNDVVQSWIRTANRYDRDVERQPGRLPRLRHKVWICTPFCEIRYLPKPLDMGLRVMWLQIPIANLDVETSTVVMADFGVARTCGHLRYRWWA